MILLTFLLSTTLITTVWCGQDIIVQDSDSEDKGVHDTGAQITSGQAIDTQGSGASTGSSSTVHRTTTTTRRKTSVGSSGGAGSTHPGGSTGNQDEGATSGQFTGAQNTDASGGLGSTATSTKTTDQESLTGDGDNVGHREDGANGHQQHTGHHDEGTQKSSMTSGGSTIVSTKTTRRRTTASSDGTDSGAGTITSTGTNHHEDEGNGHGIGATGHNEGTNEQHTGTSGGSSSSIHHHKTSGQQKLASGRSNDDDGPIVHHKDDAGGQSEAAVQQTGGEQTTVAGDNGSSGGSSSTIVSTTTTRRRKTIATSGGGATDHRDATAIGPADGEAIHPAGETTVDQTGGETSHRRHKQRSGHHARKTEHLDWTANGQELRPAGQSETKTDVRLDGSSGREDVGAAIDRKFEVLQKEQDTRHHGMRAGHHRDGSVVNLEQGEQSVHQEQHAQIGGRHHERKTGHHGNAGETIHLVDGKEEGSDLHNQITAGQQEGGIVIHREFGETLRQDVHSGHHKNGTLFEGKDGDTFRHERGQGHHAWTAGHHRKEGSSVHSEGGKEVGSGHQDGAVVFDQQFGEAIRKEVMLNQHETGSGQHQVGAGNAEGRTGIGQGGETFHKEVHATFETTGVVNGNNVTTTYPEHTCIACDEHRKSGGHWSTVSSDSSRVGRRRNRNRTFRRNGRRNRTERRSSHRLRNVSQSSHSGQPDTLHSTEGNHRQYTSGSNTFTQRRYDRKTNRIKSTRHVGIFHPQPKQGHPNHPPLHPPSHHKATKLHLASSTQIIHMWFDRFFGQYSSEWFREIVVQNNHCQYIAIILDNSTSSTSEDTSNSGSGSGSSESNEEGSNEVARDSNRTADSAEQSGGEVTQAQAASASGGVTYHLSMNENGTLSVTKQVKDANGTEIEDSSTDSTHSEPAGMNESSGTNQTDSGSAKQWGFQMDISSSGSIQSDDHPPMAAKSFALYLTAFGCWGTQIYADFLASYRSTQYPVDETEVATQQRNDTWILELVDQQANKSVGCGLDTSVNGSVMASEGMSQMRSLDFDETCLLRYGVEELPIPAGVFLAFVKHLECSAEVLSTYQSFTKVMNDEVAAMRAKGLKFAPSYFLEKAGVILSEQFRNPRITII